MLGSVRAYLTATASGTRQTAVSQCFVQSSRALPSTLAVDDHTVDEAAPKRPRVAADPADFRQLFSPHRVKSVARLLPWQRGCLATVADVGRRVVFGGGVTCSVVVTWSQDGRALYRSCGHVSLSAKDVVDRRLGLLPETTSGLSALYQCCRGYGISGRDSHGYQYSMGMGTVMNRHGSVCIIIFMHHTL